MLDVSKRGDVRLLGPRDKDAIQAVLDADPLVNVFVESQMLDAGWDLGRLNADLWGYHDSSGALASFCYAGANLIPVSATDGSIRAFAARGRRNGRACSSMWGRAEVIAPMWQMLQPAWAPARIVRSAQPFLVLDRQPAVEPDPLVRRAEPGDLDLVYEASVAFFTEELGVSPEVRGRPGAYRKRVQSTVARGRYFVRIEHDAVVFKAEIGVVSPRAFQIQGVWVPPERRGQGLSAGGVAAVVAAGMAELAPVATLYVNDFNLPARRAYAKVGFGHQATFMTILF